MNKYSKPLQVEYVNTHVPIPIDHLIRSGEKLQGKMDTLQAAQGETLARYMDIEPDRMGLTQALIDEERGRAETELDAMLEGRNWQGAMPQIQRFARDSHRRLQPIITTAGQVNTSLDQIEASNLSPEEKLLRQAALRVHASGALQAGTPFQARTWANRPDFMTGFAQALGIVAPENEMGEPTTNPDGSIRITSVQSLDPAKLQRAMQLFRDNNPDAVRYIDEMREALALTNPEFAALSTSAQRDNIAGRLNLPFLSREIADLASYTNTTYTQSNPPEEDNEDEDAPEDPLSPYGSTESEVQVPSVGYTNPNQFYGRLIQIEGSARSNGTNSGGLLQALSTRANQSGWRLTGDTAENLSVVDMDGNPVNNPATARLISEGQDLMRERRSLRTRLRRAEREFLGGKNETEYVAALPARISRGAQEAYDEVMRSWGRSQMGGGVSFRSTSRAEATARARDARNAFLVANDPGMRAFRASFERGSAAETVTLLGTPYAKAADANTVSGAVRAAIRTVPMTDPQTGRQLTADERQKVYAGQSHLSDPVVRYNPTNGNVEHLFSAGEGDNSVMFATQVPSAEAARMLSSQGSASVRMQMQTAAIRGLRNGDTVDLPVNFPLPDGTVHNYRFEVRRNSSNTFDIYLDNRKLAGNGMGGLTAVEAADRVAQIFVADAQERTRRITGTSN